MSSGQSIPSLMTRSVARLMVGADEFARAAAIGAVASVFACAQDIKIRIAAEAHRVAVSEPVIPHPVAVDLEQLFALSGGRAFLSHLLHSWGE